MLNNNIWVKYSGIYILLSIYYMSVSEEVTKMRIWCFQNKFFACMSSRKAWAGFYIALAVREDVINLIVAER